MWYLHLTKYKQVKPTATNTLAKPSYSCHTPMILLSYFSLLWAEEAKARIILGV